MDGLKSVLRRAISTVAAVAGATIVAWATSTIDPTLPLQGVPYTSTPIRNNFQAAANDINALQRGMALVSTFGADLTATVDSTAALQNCLNAVQNGTCNINPGGSLKILGNISIPAWTTLSCGVTLPTRDDNVAFLQAAPALKLGPGATISAAPYPDGQGATMKSCVVVPFGMTFPQADSHSWAGIAFSAAGNWDVGAFDNVIVGFDACMDFSGQGGLGANRPRIEGNMLDCNGVSKAALTTNAIGDSGYVRRLKIQPMASNNGDCVASMRDGVGWRATQDNEWVSAVVVLNFLDTDVVFENSGNMHATDLWVDDLNTVYPGCVGLTTKGLVIKNNNAGGSVSIGTLTLAGPFRGLTLLNNATFFSTHIGNLVLISNDEDCVRVGGDGNSAGSVSIAHVSSNSAGNVSCVGYAFNYLDTTGQTKLSIVDGELGGVRGNVAPFINVSAGALATGEVQIGRITSSLTAGSLMGGAAQPCHTVASSAAPFLDDHQTCFLISGGVTITSLTGVWDGREFTLIGSSGGPSQINTGGNIKLASGGNRTLGSGTVLRMFCQNGTCFEVAYSP